MINFNADEIIKTWPYNLSMAIVEDIDEAFMCTLPGIHKALDTINPDILEVMVLYFRDGVTYQKISELKGCSREGVRQKVRKGLRCLRHPSRYSLIYTVSRPTYLKAVKENAALKGKLQRYEIQLKTENADKELENIPIEDLDLSVRSYNCLKRAGIDNLKQLLAKDADDLFRIRNLGMTSLREIKEKVAKFGATIKSSSDSNQT